MAPVSEWKAGQEGGTPVTADRLNEMRADTLARIPYAEKGARDGVASLVGTTVPRGQLPGLGTDLEAVMEGTKITGPTGNRLSLPTHIPENTTGQATHPSVEYREVGWNGYPYWMAFTPYQGANDAMEDPNVVASVDGINWVVPAGLTNPLDDAPGSPSHYNSDTELAFGPDDCLYLFWRNLDPAATGAEEKIYYRRSADGVTWGPKTLVYQSNQATLRLLSPSLIFEDGRWTMWAVDIVATPDRIVRLRSTGSDPAYGTNGAGWGPVAAVTYRDVAGAPVTPAAAYQANKAPWHLHVVRAYGRYHMLVNDNNTAGSPPNGDLIYMCSMDGLAWISAVNPVIPRVHPTAGNHDMLYRACMIPSVQRGVLGFRVWYGALVFGANPQVWSVFRTFITDGPRSERGAVTLAPAAGTPAAPGSSFVGVTFSRPFKFPPDVSLRSSSTRTMLSVAGLSTTGMTIYAENYTSVAAGDTTINWVATEA